MIKKICCWLLLPLPVLLQGCGGGGGVVTERDCRSGPLQQELTSMQRRVNELRGNVTRGYALHIQYVEENEPYTDRDLDGRQVTRFRKVQRRVETPVAIDIDSQRAQAEVLERSVDRIADAAHQEYLKCRAGN